MLRQQDTATSMTGWSGVMILISYYKKQINKVILYLYIYIYTRTYTYISVNSRTKAESDCKQLEYVPLRSLKAADQGKGREGQLHLSC